ncbi:MAG: hypothetical protein IIY44_05705 [Erysipelotrichales bacterium]|nr:hypothetical protein [Erysipelotrichales bacterium]MBQ1386024.1 hypothetical protein [Erysipelotrichales bacterium]MBQ2309996.1 hypothetical protein [Erysipelotrichales bacterium]MBQ2478121.1 hypothetical protein [Erysipelotrichales bacterium]MBQ4011321.1 hypothetical protein [Erysipelotrichales bacterium]
MQLFLSLLPLIIVVVLLILKQHMLVAGLAGGIVAAIIGHMTPAHAAGIVQSSIGTMFSYLAPILYAAGAMMVAKSGSFKALASFAQEKLKDKVAWIAGVFVLIQALATYMAGMGAGNTMVIAPLVAAAVGAVPEVIAGMAIATAACFTTSPASTETVLAAEAAARDVAEHSSAMLLFTLLFVILGAALAVVGVMKRGTMISDANKTDESGEKYSLVQAIPAIVLVILVIFGGKINGLIHLSIFAPVINVLVAAILCLVCCKTKVSDLCNNLIDGSRFILTTLFGVGIFLGFINVIAELGTFENLAALAGKAPTALVVPAAILLAFLIAIPSGAFCAGVLTLVLPTLSLLGLPSTAMGLVAIAAGFGTQVSPVQINVAALSDGFKVDVMKVIKGNLRYVLCALVILIICSFFVH